MGTVIRDKEGAVYMTFLQCRHGSFTVDEAEAVAMRDSLSMTIEMGFTELINETDSVIVFSLLHSKKEDRSQLGLIVHEIKTLARSLREACFTHCLRNDNKVAHTTAKLAMEENVEGVWREETPASLERPVQEDVSHLLFDGH